MIIEVKNEKEMINLGQRIGSILKGGEIIELIGDVGSGKTTLVKGIASGLGVSDIVQSPSFTISRVYAARDNLSLSHYDFYRLNDAGIMTDELSETISDKKTVTVIEWSGVIEGILPKDRVSININPTNQTSRNLEIIAGGEISSRLVDKL